MVPLPTIPIFAHVILAQDNLTSMEWTRDTEIRTRTTYLILARIKPRLNVYDLRSGRDRWKYRIFKIFQDECLRVREL